jgi:hypothetical protein
VSGVLVGKVIDATDRQTEAVNRLTLATLGGRPQADLRELTDDFEPIRDLDQTA